jgi:putative tryptophan/tyrosine transport system substrate-binding protein
MQYTLFTHTKMIAALIILWVWSSPLLAEKTAHILVVVNSYDSPYQEAVTGFKEQISAHTKIKFTELTLAQAQSSGVEEIKRHKPDLIYALGTETSKWASLQTSRIPIVATMVRKDDVFRQSASMTGVSLGYSFKAQFQWLKKLFPLKKTVAILFNPNENSATVRAAREASQQTGFNLVAIPVESPKELPFALEQLANNVDTFFYPRRDGYVC